MLRQQYKSLLSRFLSGEVRKYRTQYRLTQEQLSVPGLTQTWSMAYAAVPA